MGSDERENISTKEKHPELVSGRVPPALQPSPTPQAAWSPRFPPDCPDPTGRTSSDTVSWSPSVELLQFRCCCLGKWRGTQVPARKTVAFENSELWPYPSWRGENGPELALPMLHLRGRDALSSRAHLEQEQSGSLTAQVPPQCPDQRGLHWSEPPPRLPPRPPLRRLHARCSLPFGWPCFCSATLAWHMLQPCSGTAPRGNHTALLPLHSPT